MSMHALLSVVNLKPFKDDAAKKVYHLCQQLSCVKINDACMLTCRSGQGALNYVGMLVMNQDILLMFTCAWCWCLVMNSSAAGWHNAKDAP